MIREVVISREVDVTKATKDKGYLMKGNKGDYILARDTEDKFIFVRVNSGKVTKVYHKYDTIEQALTDKLEKGYEVFEYNNEEDLSELLG